MDLQMNLKDYKVEINGNMLTIDVGQDGKLEAETIRGLTEELEKYERKLKRREESNKPEPIQVYRVLLASPESIPKLMKVTSFIEVSSYDSTKYYWVSCDNHRWKEYFDDVVLPIAKTPENEIIITTIKAYMDEVERIKSAITKLKGSLNVADLSSLENY